MNNKIKNSGFVLLFVIGLSILLYPTVSNMWNQHRAEMLMTDYEQVITETDDEEISREFEKVTEYNKTLLGQPVPDAFSIREDVKDAQYESLLNPAGSGIMGTIEIPVIDVKLPIYHYTTEEVLEKGVGHLFGSSLPMGGKGTHAVISAHRGLPSAELFTNLDRVKIGDRFYIRVYDEVMAYEVDQILTVLPDETQSLATEEDKDLVTLMTCTPYGVNTHRLLVRGHRVEYEEELYGLQQSSHAPVSTSMFVRVLCGVLGLLLAALIVFLFGRRQKKSEEKKYEPEEDCGESGKPDEAGEAEEEQLDI